MAKGRPLRLDTAQEEAQARHDLRAQVARLKGEKAALGVALRDTAKKLHYVAEHEIAFEDCYSPFCQQARAALDALEVK